MEIKSETMYSRQLFVFIDVHRCLSVRLNLKAQFTFYQLNLDLILD